MSDLIFYIVLIPFIFLINNFLRKRNLLINTSGSKHQTFAASQKVPLSGGIIILIFFLLNNETPDNQTFSLFLLFFFMLGFISDNSLIKSPIQRFFLQIILLASFAYFFELRIINTKVYILDNLLENYYINFLFVIFCLLILINGTNFIDGCNTLSVGYYILVLLVLLKLSLLNTINLNDIFVYKFLLILIIIYVFNIFNKLYLGDNGVYLLSLIFGYYLISISFYNPSISPFFVVLLLWYPAFENLFSLIRKLRLNKSPLYPDTYHFHQLLFYFLKKKISKKNNFISGLTSNLINIYNGFMLLLGSTKIYDTTFLVSLIIINIFLYIYIYLRLFSFRLKK